jgi:hypothetical protein
MNSYGYAGGPASYGDEGMGAVETMGAVSAPAPTAGYPVTGDPRQHAVNNPTQIRQDAANLRLLDYPAPDTGNAYDPAFRAAVRAFQTRMGSEIVGPIDGLIGPTTRGVLVDVVRGLGSNNAPGGQAVVPGGGGSLSNASAGGGFPGGLLGIGIAGAAALGLGWWLLKS